MHRTWLNGESHLGQAEIGDLIINANVIQTLNEHFENVRCFMNIFVFIFHLKIRIRYQ